MPEPAFLTLLFALIKVILWHNLVTERFCIRVFLLLGYLPAQLMNITNPGLKVSILLG